MKEIQVAQRNLKVTIVDDLFGTSTSMGHCISSDVFMGAVIAQRVDQLYPQVKNEASTELTLRSVFAFYDLFTKVDVQFGNETQILSLALLWSGG